jgi:hypothetical protein
MSSSLVEVLRGVCKTCQAAEDEESLSTSLSQFHLDKREPEKENRVLLK